MSPHQLALVLAGSIVAAAGAEAATLTVTSTAPTGIGSFDWAVDQANAAPTEDHTIRFDLPPATRLSVDHFDGQRSSKHWKFESQHPNDLILHLETDMVVSNATFRGMSIVGVYNLGIDGGESLNFDKVYINVANLFAVSTKSFHLNDVTADISFLAFHETKGSIENSTLMASSTIINGRYKSIYYGAYINITNSTIVGDVDLEDQDAPVSLSLYNSIVSGGVVYAGDRRELRLSGTHSLLGDSANNAAFCSQRSNICDVDPLLGPLADNGGPIPTRALLPGSPAIDAGGSSELVFDARGFPRMIGDAVDLGAYEYGASPVPIPAAGALFLPALAALILPALAAPRLARHHNGARVPGAGPRRTGAS